MLKFIADHWDELLLIITSINVIAGVITAMTPTPKDDDILRIIRKYLNMAALNVGHARNAESVGCNPSTPDKPAS